MTKSKNRIVCIIIVVLIIGIGIYWWRDPIEYQLNERYCSKFNYANCPKECELGPSCPGCWDIECHSKEFRERWH